MKERSSEYIHSCYIFSVIQNMHHPYKEDSFLIGENLLDRLKKGDSFSWEEIHNGYSTVERRTNEYANSNGLDPRSSEAALGYWLIDHNRIIRNGLEEYRNMPKPQKDICETRLSRVLRPIKTINGTQKLEVETDNGEVVEVVDFIYGNLKPGEYISTHNGIVALKLTEKEYKFYKQTRKQNEN